MTAEAQLKRNLRPAEMGLAALAATALLFFILAGIGRPLWHDEANAALMSSHNFQGLLQDLRQDNNLPVYYVLLSCWMRLFGESEAALRSLSVVFYLAGAGMVFLLGSALYKNRRAALYAVVLYVGSTQLIHQAQTVRMYTMLGFLSAASLLLFFRIFVEEKLGDALSDGKLVKRQPGEFPAGQAESDAGGFAAAHVQRSGAAGSRWLFGLYIVVNAVGVLTQVWFSFVLLGQFLCLLRQRRGLTKFIACGAVSGSVFLALWGPAFLHQLHNGSTSWLPPFHPIFLLDILVEFYGNQGVGLIVLLACAVPLVAARGERSAFWRADGGRNAVVVLLACLVTPLAVSIVKPIYYPARYSTVGLPVLAVFLGAILARFASRPYALAVCYGVLIASTVWHVREHNTVGDGDLPPGQSDRTTAEYILQHAAPGDYIVFTNLTHPAADYYFRRNRQENRFVEITFPQELDRHAGWLDRAAMLRRPDALAGEASRTTESLAAAAQSGKRIWMYNGLPGVSEFLKSNLDARLTLAARHDLRGSFHRELLEYAASADQP